MGVCKAPSSFCFNCCKVDNAFLKSDLCVARTVFGILLVRMKPPITLVERVFLWCQMVGMVFIRESVPCSAKFFVSIVLNHSITEFWISYESIMDALEELLLALFLQLVGRMVFRVSQLFTISMSVRSSFLDDVLRNRMKVHRRLDELLFRPSSFTQEVPARAIDDANVPV